MANITISGLPAELLAGAVDPLADVLEIDDVDAGVTKRITAGALVGGGGLDDHLADVANPHVVTQQQAYDAGEAITQAAATPLALTNNAGGAGLLVQDTVAGDSAVFDELGITGDGTAALEVTTVDATVLGASARSIFVAPGDGAPGNAGTPGGAGAPTTARAGRGGPNAAALGDGGVGGDGVFESGGGGGVTGTGTGGAPGSATFRCAKAGSSTTAGGGTPAPGGPSYFLGGEGGGIIPDNAISADGGPAYLDGGEGGATHGDVLIGTLHTQAVTIGSGATPIALAGLPSMPAVLVTGGSNTATLTERPSDAGTPAANSLALYAKDSSGVSALYARTDDGVVHRLTTPEQVESAAKTAAYTLAATDLERVITIDSSGGAFDLDLPDPATLPAGWWARIVDVGGALTTNPVTLSRFGAETISGVAANYLLRADHGEWILRRSGSDWLLVGRNRAVQTFLTSGSFVVPARVSQILVKAIRPGAGGGASGGGGGAGASANVGGGGGGKGGSGGGGAGSVRDLLLAVTPGESLTMTVGAGGAGGAGVAAGAAGLAGSAGGISEITRGATVLLRAAMRNAGGSASTTASGGGSAAQAGAAGGSSGGAGGTTGSGAGTPYNGVQAVGVGYNGVMASAGVVGGAGGAGGAAGIAGTNGSGLGSYTQGAVLSAAVGITNASPSTGGAQSGGTHGGGGGGGSGTPGGFGDDIAQGTEAAPVATDGMGATGGAGGAANSAGNGTAGGAGGAGQHGTCGRGGGGGAGGGGGGAASGAGGAGGASGTGGNGSDGLIFIEWWG